MTLLLPDADQTDADGAAASDDDDLGGLFKVVNKEQPGGRRQSSSVQGGLNDRDCSFFPVEGVQDWSLKEVCVSLGVTVVLLIVRMCFFCLVQFGIAYFTRFHDGMCRTLTPKLLIALLYYFG